MAKLDRDEIYEYIEDFCKKHNGVPPTLRLIGKAFGVDSTSHVQYHMRKLVQEGKIAKVPDTQIYCVVGAKWLPPGRDSPHG